MKRLALFLFLLLPVSAHAQVGPEVYRPATGAQILAFDTVAPTSITNVMTHQMARLVCTAACYVALKASGQNLTVTSTTGIYLPANVPVNFGISRNSKIVVLGVAGSGNLHILELTK